MCWSHSVLGHPLEPAGSLPIQTVQYHVRNCSAKSHPIVEMIREAVLGVHHLPWGSELRQGMESSRSPGSCGPEP